MSSSGTPVPAPTPTPAPAPTAPWYEGHIPANADGTPDTTLVGHLQNRGWDKLDPVKAAITAAKSHHEAEKALGGPRDRIMWRPKDAGDAENWGKINSFLGVPADVKEYDFSGIKFTDGDNIDESFLTALRPALQAARVSKDAAPAIVKALVAHMETSDAAEAKVKADALNTERDALRINWGSNTEANLVVAKNAAAALNIKPEAVAALEGQIGYAAVMEMFRNIGSKIGEDRFVRSQAPGNSGVMSVDQAKTTLDERQNDSEWVRKLNAGDTVIRKEFDNLTRMVAGVR